MGIVDKVSSYLAVTYYRQTPAKRFGLMLCYFATGGILAFLVIATIGLLFS